MDAKQYKRSRGKRAIVIVLAAITIEVTIVFLARNYAPTSEGAAKNLSFLKKQSSLLATFVVPLR